MPVLFVAGCEPEGEDVFEVDDDVVPFADGLEPVVLLVELVFVPASVV